MKLSVLIIVSIIVAFANGAPLNFLKQLKKNVAKKLPVTSLTGELGL